MRYEIRTSRRADADIEQHIDHICRWVSTISAAKWRDRLVRRMDNLARDPAMWPIAEEAAEVGSEVRMCLFGNRRQVYRILFRIEGAVVRILRVRHASQDSLSGDEIG